MDAHGCQGEAKFCDKACLVNGEPSQKKSSGPGCNPRMDMKLNRAATGQRSLSILPKKRLTPSLNGSVLEHLIRIITARGSDCESKVTSEIDRFCKIGDF